MTTTHYDTLGLSQDATDQQITTAYRRLVRDAHPDRGGDSDEFDKIRQAYTALRDARAQYDESLRSGTQPAEAKSVPTDVPPVQEWGVSEEVPVSTPEAPLEIPVSERPHAPWAQWTAFGAVALAVGAWTRIDTLDQPVLVLVWQGLVLIAAVLFVATRKKPLWGAVGGLLLAAMALAAYTAPDRVTWGAVIGAVLLVGFAVIGRVAAAAASRFIDDHRLPRQWEEFAQFARVNGGMWYVKSMKTGGPTFYSVHHVAHTVLAVHPETHAEEMLYLDDCGVPYTERDWIVVNTANDVIATCPDRVKQAWDRVHNR